MILPAEEFTGRLIITWPRSARPVLLPPLTILHDADSREQIMSVTAFTINAHVAESVVTADLTMLAGADGKPLAADATPVLDDGNEPLTGVFRWVVAEMRIAE